MAGYDTNDVAELLRQLGAHDQLLAEAYVFALCKAMVLMRVRLLHYIKNHY